ncbi:MAG: methyltransferase domain-containing protein [Flavobacteriaceae bacterium]|nr:methyltransferase domain-containing protein [Flavobacteriaceae bacterium]
MGTLAVRLTDSGESRLRRNHPWIFDKQIEKIKPLGRVGDLCVIFSKGKNKVMGIGLYDPDSPIRIKMIHHNGPAAIDCEFFRTKIDKAFKIRQELLEGDTNGYRLIFGENDGFPGLIADVYAHVLVVKLYSAIWQRWLKQIIEHITALTKVKSVIMRLSRKMISAQIPGWTDGQVIYGTIEEEIVQFREHGVLFWVNPIRGHKTGFFLDHRHNRKRVGELSKGKNVLDVFTYSGGFSVHALAGGAKTVSSIDISSHALEQATTNAELNNYQGQHKTICGNAFEVLQDLIAANKTYDLVIIDPPSFAKQASEVKLALKKYRQLARMGATLTSNRGILVVASCSSRVSSEAFFKSIAEELDKSERAFKLLEQTTHDLDHPIGFPEGAYLKCGFYRAVQ